MKLSAIIEGLQIAQKYYDSPDSYQTCAEHDVLHLYPTAPMSQEDFDRMVELGWRQNHWRDEKTPYDHAEGWRAFT